MDIIFEKEFSVGELDNRFGLLTLGKENYVNFHKLDNPEVIARYANRAGHHKLEAEYDAGNLILSVHPQDRVILNNYYNGVIQPQDSQNRMGCSESWYDPYYAISQTFTADEVDKMDDKHLKDLVKLASEIQGALY